MIFPQLPQFMVAFQAVTQIAHSGVDRGYIC
jgi:hypothetical protein